MSNLHLILGDQLSASISSLQGYNPTVDTILMCEVYDEATYVKHHKKKIAFLFSAMRHFARELQQKGFQVQYVNIDEKENSGTFRGEVKRALKQNNYERIIVTFPGEYRVLQDMWEWQNEFKIPVEIRPDDRFLCSLEEFSDWATKRRNVVMEYFYREMRQKYNLLMHSGQPEGGKWNYDTQNRKPPPKGSEIPPPYIGQKNKITQRVINSVETKFGDHFGDIEPFYFAVTRTDALKVLYQFVNQRLKYFGDYQDAMIEGEAWMYHSHISFYLNCGLLLPLECAKIAETAYYNGTVTLNAAEGFIRQIVGWREYVRGLYWAKMPDYKQLNFFKAQRDLPTFYWSAQTKMNCLYQCISETKRHAYAHHIQRLMILGNFALLAEIDPDQVNEWFLIVYADAYEWVELPNVSGMILFADGGYLASKPYAASGNYINKMSNYCKNCSYKVSIKNGANACPFNYLYWDFLDRNRDKLQSNHRIGMMYKTLDRMSEDKKNAIRTDSDKFLQNISDGNYV